MPALLKLAGFKVDPLLSFTYKRWNAEGYAGNLFERNVENLIGVNLMVRF